MTTKFLISLCAAAALLAACGDRNKDMAPDTTTTPATPSEAPPPADTPPPSTDTPPPPAETPPPPADSQPTNPPPGGG